MMLTSIMPRQARQVFEVTLPSRSACTIIAMAGIFSASNIAWNRLKTIEI